MTIQEAKNPPPPQLLAKTLQPHHQDLPLPSTMRPQLNTETHTPLTDTVRKLKFQDHLSSSNVKANPPQKRNWKEFNQTEDRKPRQPNKSAKNFLDQTDVPKLQPNRKVSKVTCSQLANRPKLFKIFNAQGGAQLHFQHKNPPHNLSTHPLKTQKP